MSIHEELVAKTLMAKPTTDEEWLNIDWESRLITIPSTLTNIGVYNDKDTNRLYFRCPIEYGEFRIADFGIHVNYQNTGKSNTKYDGDVYFVDDVESDGEYLTFSWLVGRHAYLEQGTTAFIVCCKVVDSDDNVVNELNTTVATLSVLEGLEVDANPEDYPDYLEELLKKVEAAEETAQEAKDAVQSAQNTADEALTRANEVEDSALTGITVNGEDAPVNNHVAEIEVVADVPIEHIKVNGTEQPIEDKTVDIEVPTELSELDNDVGYITNDALDGYALEDQIPTKVSELTNDIPYATEDDVQAVADSAITGVTVNGTEQPVNNNIAELTIEEGGGAIEHIQVNGEEQPIEDKTVNLDIDRASVEDETLIVGDTTGGGGYYVGYLVNQTVRFKTDELAVFFYMRGSSSGVGCCMGGTIVSPTGSGLSNCGYEDGEYYLTNPNGRDEYFILINAYDITIED